MAGMAGIAMNSNEQKEPRRLIDVAAGAVGAGVDDDARAREAGALLRLPRPGGPIEGGLAARTAVMAARLGASGVVGMAAAARWRQHAADARASVGLEAAVREHVQE